jgi:hypothetical protein
VENRQCINLKPARLRLLMSMQQHQPAAAKNDDERQEREPHEVSRPKSKPQPYRLRCAVFGYKGNPRDYVDREENDTDCRRCHTDKLHFCVPGSGEAMMNRPRPAGRNR